MLLTRRQTLQFGIAGLGAATLVPFTARAQGAGDTYEIEGGQITIFPVSHASFVMTIPGMVIYADPVGGAEAYEGHPAPDLILITHEHGDHYDPETLTAIVQDSSQLITNPAVFEMLPEELKGKASAIANGESSTVNDLQIEAIPAYNTTEDRLQYHPEGRDNGYVLTVGGRRVYIAGDTEDIPEMRALEGIYIAFVPMNLPYTMDINQAASAVSEFAPTYVYPYHYMGSDVQAFSDLVAETEAETEVVLGNWYT